MVRLLPIAPIISRIDELCFNPTMVRLLRDSGAGGRPDARGFNPTMVRLLHGRWQDSK